MPLKFLNGIDLNGQRARGAADGSQPTDLVTLQQLQAYARGLDWKDAVAAASTGNIDLSAPGTLIDGVNMNTSGNKRFLAKNQSDATLNGIYVWNGASTPATRAVDADSSPEVTQGMAVTVTGGTVNAANGPTAWVLTTNDPITLGTTALSFTQLGGSSAPYVAGMGLILTGSTFDIGQGNGIIVEADAIRVDGSVVVRKYAANCSTANPQIFTHGLGTNDVDVIVREVATGAEVIADNVASAGTVSVDFGGTPNAGQYRVTIQA